MHFYLTPDSPYTFYIKGDTDKIESLEMKKIEAVEEEIETETRSVEEQPPASSLVQLFQKNRKRPFGVPRRPGLTARVSDNIRGLEEISSDTNEENVKDVKSEEAPDKVEGGEEKRIDEDTTNVVPAEESRSRFGLPRSTRRKSIFTKEPSTPDTNTTPGVLIIEEVTTRKPNFIRPRPIFRPKPQLSDKTQKNIEDNKETPSSTLSSPITSNIAETSIIKKDELPSSTSMSPLESLFRIASDKNKESLVEVSTLSSTNRKPEPTGIRKKKKKLPTNRNLLHLSPQERMVQKVQETLNQNTPSLNTPVDDTSARSSPNSPVDTEPTDVTERTLKKILRRKKKEREGKLFSEEVSLTRKKVRIRRPVNIPDFPTVYK